MFPRETGSNSLNWLRWRWHNRRREFQAKGGRVRKSIVVLLAAALTMAAVGVLGCDDTNKAKTYLEQAKKDWDKAKRDYQKEIEANIKLFLAAGEQQAGAAVGQLVEAVKADRQEADMAVKNLLEAARTAYVKVTDLIGVDEYVAYAQSMIVAIDRYEALVDADVALDTKLKAAFASGNQATIEAALRGARDDIGNLEELEKEARDAWDKAQSLKKNLK